MSTSTKGARKKTRSASIDVELYEAAFTQAGIEAPKTWSRLPAPAPKSTNAVSRA
jgi:hypothetical protein